MKVAIVGSSGYIAGFLIERFNAEHDIETILKLDQVGEVDAYLNLCEAEKFNYGVLEGVDFVIFTAAISSPDKCASDFELAWAINVTGTAFFIKQAIKKNCHVLFFSSDAVFGDIPGKIYDENSETLAETPYGRMKKAIEDEFKGNKLFKAIRLSYVASSRDRFVSYCMKCVENNEVVDVFHPFYRNVIIVRDVVDVVAWFVHNWEKYSPFVLNVAGGELVSRVRIADEINRIINGRLEYTISKPDDNFYKNRPAITQMRSLYLDEYNILPNENFTEKIQRTMEEMKSE